MVPPAAMRTEVRARVTGEEGEEEEDDGDTAFSPNEKMTLRPRRPLESRRQPDMVPCGVARICVLKNKIKCWAGGGVR